MTVECVEVWFNGGLRHARKLEGKRAMKVYEMTGGAPIGTTFKACRMFQQEVLAGKRKGDRTRLFMRVPLWERYEIAGRRVIGKTVILRAKAVA